MIYLLLFWSFFKIGAVTYGGGYAMISLIQQEVVTRGWINAADFANMVAVSQMTPGPIAANTAVFVGRTQAGITGAAAAMFGLALPPLIYSSIAILFLQKLKDSSHFQSIIRGIRAAAMGLIAAAVVFFAENSLITGSLPKTRREYLEVLRGKGGFTLEPAWTGIAVFAVVLTLLIRVRIKPYIALAISAAMGTGLYFLFMA